MTKKSCICMSVLVSAVFFMCSGLAYAGAGANVKACIYLPVKPLQEMTASFTVGGSGTHCMNKKGNNTSFTVSAAGVTCGSVGYVEEKGSSTKGDVCATDTSLWVLSYNLKTGSAPTPYSGSTNSKWSHPLFKPNHMSLKDQSPKTVVCTTTDLCDATSQQWDSGTQGPLYIIFQPQSQ